MKRDWEDIWGHCIAGVLGNMYTGMGIGNYSEYNRNA